VGLVARAKFPLVKEVPVVLVKSDVYTSFFFLKGNNLKIDWKHIDIDIGSIC